VQAVLDDVRARDERLGRRRPDAVRALVEALSAQLEAARRLRLARDGWALRSDVFRAYRRDVGEALRALENGATRLEDIRALAGPEAKALVRLRDRFETARRLAARVAPPRELQDAHAMLLSALQLARAACEVRLEAVRSGELSRAWDASSAAAGALMLGARAREAIEARLKPPSVP
jgi:hypothetical protein